eukprot:1734250-Prymnesium_polylepis.1
MAACPSGLPRRLLRLHPLAQVPDHDRGVAERSVIVRCPLPLRYRVAHLAQLLHDLADACAFAA